MTSEGWTAVASLTAALASIAAIAEHCVAMFKRKRREDAVADDKALVSVNGDDTAVDQEPHDGDVKKDTRKYAINGAGEYGKSRMVLEIIRRYVCDHPAVSYPQLEEVFPPALRGIKREGSHWGCFNRKEDAVALMNDTGRCRHFLNDADIIRLADGTQIAVSSQWGIGNVHYFIAKATALGFDIREISVVKRVGSLIGFVGVCMTVMMSLADTEVVDGIEWKYTVSDGKAEIFNDRVAAIPSGITGSITVPSTLGDCPVTSIGNDAFYKCSGLTSVTIPSSVTSIGVVAFDGCTGLTSVTISEGVTSIGDLAFAGCTSLLRVYYHGNAPAVGYDLYGDAPATLVSYVREGSTGWSSGASTDLPDSWQGRSIAHGEAPVVIDGVEWNFTTKNGKVSLGTGLMTAVGGSVSGGVTIPAEINGKKVVEIKDGAFAGLDGITSVIIPASVRTVGSKAFYGCDGLETVTFLGDAPYVYDDAFSGTKSTLAFSVPQGSIGWSDTSLTGLPGAWKGHAIQYAGGGQDAGGSAASLGTVTVSNIVVHYVLNSVQPQFAISPSQDMGFVNIITEVKSTGVAAIPMSWAMNYPNFVSKFGSDFTAALGKPTGKIGTGGTPMLVWQDYVAGTDPTNEKDVFTASITIVDGKVTISYTPELDDARKAMRKYTTWGKTSLMDKNWTEVQDGHEAEYNFFKVSVEMR